MRPHRWTHPALVPPRLRRPCSRRLNRSSPRGESETILVAYASRHGATAGIANSIADGLTGAGVTVELRHVDDVHDMTGYDAFVIGSAAYMFHWLKDATAFVRQQRGLLAERPVWLFSSGPIGSDLVDKKGRDVLEVSRPKEFQEFQSLIRPRGEKVLFGAWDPDEKPVGMASMIARVRR